ncbi:hypothetical protein [Mesorhizobium sp.]|uniref:hypothetical protein n=1 Tax=Mesorhizobium sp. TaxID=1871066 RepID=UPI001216A43F|nr:hypothetical protein [Mesorhizobium sp.]TIL36199.1 MAG: hypothetical protein E5Y85_00805 [Mesorhizobium sp.]
MTAWFRRACDRAFNLGLSIGELTRRVHGATDNRQMVDLAIDLERTLQLDELEYSMAVRLTELRWPDQATAGELAERATKLFREKTGRAA